jgi:crotonobetainyl-CoA:carnitine CoA-transferase CaiB-like acyl-CoA transferase
MLGLQNEREWKAFCDQVLQQPALATDQRFASNPKRVALRTELYELIAQAFSRLTAVEVVQRLEAAQIANAQVNTMAEVWAHPQLQARERWTAVDTSVGSIPALLPPGSWMKGPPRMDAVPALGQHTDIILCGLGYSSEQLATLRAQGAV